MSHQSIPIKKLLIANRGEIACRIINTARKMGIHTVAVYSDADKNSLHTQMADEAIAIGKSPSSESYLVIDKIIDACTKTGADAVHPGFGFLSENARFAQELSDAGIRFVGPGIKAIQIMGDKIESKKLAKKSGVNTVPGHPDAMDTASDALSAATTIGCPVMLKASAGGGGKGMRIAWTLDTVEENFISAQNEARSAFGDDRVFVEKFIERPRHIEIQVLGDTHGNCLYLGERECSIQRRHQKVIEEAPSPFIDEATRKAMGEQAVQLAKAVDYYSAGTVEFIVDKNRQFYFLEMNTRLQVEHPVTECITGLDLVEQMLRVTEGEKLTLRQNDVKLNGWALEARVYAEDADRNFMPSTGRLTRYIPPKESSSVRVDTGVFEGGEISMFYDPMIAKLVTSGKTREDAINSMKMALDAYAIRGVQHNIPFLTALVDHPEFRAGNLTTGFIDEHYPDGFDSAQNRQSDSTIEIVLAAHAQQLINEQALSISGQINHDKSPSLKMVAVMDDHQYDIFINDDDGISVNNNRYALSTDWMPGDLLAKGDFNGRPFVAQIEKQGNHWKITHGGAVSTLLLLSHRVAELNKLMPVKVPPDLSRFLLSPMPGLLARISVGVGDVIKAGQELAVVEAMKMENILIAEQDGVVKSVPVEEGSSLAVDEIIVEFE